MQVAIGLYEGFAALDAIGPYQVFTVAPDTEVVLCAARRGPLRDEPRLLELGIEHTFDDVPAPDLVIVPGGVNTRAMVQRGDPIVDWVRSVHAGTTYTTSVCTGALILGAAGLLEGVPATTHWCAYDHLRALGAQPTEERVVFADRIVTAAGVSAGIDLALALVGRLHGDVVAQAIQLGIEYDPQPPYDAGAPSKAPDDVRELVRAVMREAEERVAASS